MAFEDSDLWLNKTESGKGVTLSKSGEDNDFGLYSIPVSQLEELLNGNRSGVNLSRIVDDDPVEE